MYFRNFTPLKTCAIGHREQPQKAHSMGELASGRNSKKKNHNIFDRYIRSDMSTMVDKHSFYDYYLFSEAHDRRKLSTFSHFDCQAREAVISRTTSSVCYVYTGGGGKHYTIIIPNVITSVAWPNHYDENISY